jgi:TPR repeat protein
LRHGWGIPPEPDKAIHFLSLAASNSASIEEQALASGVKKGGAAKGELVLAIFELANCFRHGWGVKKDAVAARQYYETAANLGDTDAMEEAAWCYLEGFGGSKDKVRRSLLLHPVTRIPRRETGAPCPLTAKRSPQAMLRLRAVMGGRQ